MTQEKQNTLNQEINELESKSNSNNDHQTTQDDSEQDKLESKEDTLNQTDSINSESVNDNNKPQQSNFWDELFKDDQDNTDNTEDTTKNDNFWNDILNNNINSNPNVTSDYQPKMTDEEIKVKRKENFGWLDDLMDEINKSDKKKAQAAELGKQRKLEQDLKKQKLLNNSTATNNNATGDNNTATPSEVQLKPSTNSSQTKSANQSILKKYFNIKNLIVGLGILICIQFIVILYILTNSSNNNMIIYRSHLNDKIIIDNNKVVDGYNIIKQGFDNDILLNVIYQYLQPGDKVIEVGSGFGYLTLYLSKLVGSEGQVYAFEARKDVLMSLNDSLKLNNITNVALYNAFLYSNTTQLNLAPIKTGKFGSIIESEHGEATAVFTLNDILKDVKNISMMIINAHNLELNVLLGATDILASSPRIKIFTQWNTKKMQQNINTIETIKFFNNLGYKFWLIDKKTGAINELMMQDNILDSIPDNSIILISKRL